MKEDLKKILPLHLRLGNNAETAAEKYLVRQGLSCLERNYRCKAGEIDLLMQDADTLVFIEVRYRSCSLFGSAAESITPAKIQRIRKTAEHFLQTHRCHANLYQRFDVIAITARTTEKDIVWIKDAF